MMEYYTRTFMCEHDDCTNIATIEWYDHSEFADKDESEPSAYYTFRCDEHPVKNNWQVRDL